MKVFVLIGEYGEYEVFTRVALGAFSSKDLAQASIEGFARLGETGYAAYQAWEERKKDFLKQFCKPTAIYPAGSPFPQGHVSYCNEDHARAAKHAGIEPEWIVGTYEKYEIIEMGLDEVNVPVSATIVDREARRDRSI